MAKATILQGIKMQLDSPVQELDELEAAQKLTNIPHFTIPRPSQLKRERLIFAASIALPFLGFIGAIALAAYSGITASDWILFLSMFFITVLGIEVGYHRLFSHHAFETIAPIRAFWRSLAAWPHKAQSSTGSAIIDDTIYIVIGQQILTPLTIAAIVPLAYWQDYGTLI